MCRYEAKQLTQRMDDIQKAGAKRVVAVVKEADPKELQEFSEFWSGEILHDKGQAFFKAVGGGELRRLHSSGAGFLATLANPFGARGSEIRANAKKASDDGVKQNFNGEGFVSGGLYVVGKTGKAEFSFAETEYGRHASIDDVVKAVSTAAQAA